MEVPIRPWFTELWTLLLAAPIVMALIGLQDQVRRAFSVLTLAPPWLTNLVEIAVLFALGHRVLRQVNLPAIARVGLSAFRRS